MVMPATDYRAPLQAARDELRTILARRPAIEPAALAGVVDHLITSRDIQMAAGRSGLMASALSSTNAVLSLAYSVAYPLDGVQWPRIEATLAAVDQLLEETHGTD
jgi:hypothetical protein